MSAPRVTLVAGVFAAAFIGCAATCGQGPGDQAEAPSEPAEAPEAAPEETDGAEAPDDRPILPTFTDEVLAARVKAQERLLGSGPLFEDLHGKPVVIEMPEEDTEGDDPEAQMELEMLDALPGSAGLDPAHDTAGPAVNGNTLGLFVPIENPPTPALGHFHAQLRALEDGKTDRVRVLLYGASHTQADKYPGYVRTYLQSRFGAAGRGFVPLAKINKWHSTVDFSIDQSRHWKVEHAQREHRDGYFGMLGASAYTTQKNATIKLTPRHPEDEAAIGSVYEVQYLAQPGGGRFTVYLDGKAAGTIKTKADAPQLGIQRFEIDPGPHELMIRTKGDGEVRVFGVDITNGQKGVVVDTLAISGTRMSNQLKWDETLWSQTVQEADPDLYVFFFGTNETSDSHQPIEAYRKQVETVLERYHRAAPDASCLLMGPGDFNREQEDGTWQTPERLLQIIATQRAVAYEYGCGFWDAMAFMGGPGTMREWATSRPRMASKDHIHLSKRGYVRLAMAVTDALMVEYDAAPPE